MALGSLITPSLILPSGGPSPLPSVPVSLLSSWFACCTDLTVADNAGAAVVAPYGLTRATSFPFSMLGKATSFLARMAYDSTKAVSTAPVVQFWGFDGAGGLASLVLGSAIPMPLVSADGSQFSALASDTTNDVKFNDGSIVWAYSAWVQFDAMGSLFVLPGIKTAAVQASSGIPQLQVKLL